MAELNNLTEQNVTDLQEYFSKYIKPDNPKASMILKPMAEILRESDNCDEEYKKEFQKLNDKIDALNIKIDRIFDNHYLMNGRFCKFNDPELHSFLTTWKK